MKELEYPFDAEEILRKKKSYKKQLLSQDLNWMDKKVAILGGQTTENIKLMLELFLLNNGIRPQFYESEYNKYYEDGMFPNPELESFAPDIIYICTCIRNITDLPSMSDGPVRVEDKLEQTFMRFTGLWDRIADTYKCTVIQNDFELPYYRVLGNMDASDIHGRVNFVTRLNCKLYEYAVAHENFHICGVNYISAAYGLDKWSDPFFWHMYKYGMALPAIPYLAFNVANIIKSVYGKNKKALSLDLDNTLWGGIVGDDGADNIEIGQETPVAQTYSEFQSYLKQLGDRGIMLTVNSKNDEENALAGLNRPDSVLKPDDFAVIKANWEPKSSNLIKTAEEMNILPESFVFADDNPAERAIVEGQIPGIAVPLLERPEHYVSAIDKTGYFEATTLSDDDIKRNEMYMQNAKRTKQQAAFENYEDYLISLEMQAEIRPFVPEYMSRIAQLTNKSNQFNLTTKRYTQSELEEIAGDKEHITLYGKLVDKFGDNGVVSVVIGKKENDLLHIELWLMSCRVLKRDMEYAMMDRLIKLAKDRGITKLVGYYHPTAKNSMVRTFYETMGFTKTKEDEKGNTVWEYRIPDDYEDKQHVIAYTIG
ncbi:MAG: HAD-IIIC family phosphatase [Lachnospiraceae bacterium]|nr:HAD-IIIC family phosphatase [Lachnospiraceae bacterium]